MALTFALAKDDATGAVTVTCTEPAAFRRGRRASGRVRPARRPRPGAPSRPPGSAGP
jgi:hypothetical protein